MARPSVKRADTSETSALTPEQYADAIRYHSRQTVETSLFPGHNFENLATYLRRDFEYKSRGSVSQSHGLPLGVDEFPFLSVYSWDGVGSWTSRIDCTDPSQCQDLPPARDKPMILFLKGKPSSKWLSTLGATYKIDPEFFNRHLDFYANLGRTDYFSTPSLPSEQIMMFQVPYMTIGHMAASSWQHKQSTVNTLRLEAAQKMAAWWDRIYNMFTPDYGTGESLVRQFHVHDQTNFALEQRISVALNRTAGSWQLLIWLDTGKPLSQSQQCAPWHGLTASNPSSGPRRTSIYPTIQVQPSVALKSHLHRVETARETHDDLAHNVSLLHQNYGQCLDPATMAASPFYSLYNILHFVAVTYRQYFNMLEQKDNRRMSATIHGTNGLSRDDPENWDSTNLRHDRAVLEGYLPQLQSTLEVIRHRGNSAPPLSPNHIWPCQTKDGAQHARVSASFKSLERDYQDLIDHARRLLNRYSDNTAFLMNQAVTVEASKSLAQAREVTKLTRLAFIYIPLSFTCSFFGMNVSELSHWGSRDTPQLVPMWLWVIFSAPFLLFSLVLLTWDLEDLRKLYRSCKRTVQRCVRRNETDEKGNGTQKDYSESVP